MTGNLAVPPKFSNVTALDLQITAADRSNLFRGHLEETDFFIDECLLAPRKLSGIQCHKYFFS